MLTALLVILILVLLVVVHEFGHFIAAKIFGVRVDEFGVGYPPRAFSLGTWGGTAYTLNWLPFGGFVRLYGDEGTEERGRGSLMDSPRWKQGIILIAGVAMNAIAAWLLLTAALHTGVPQVVDTASAGEHAQLLVSGVVPGSPADAAGLKVGDEVTHVVDNKGVALTPLSPSSMVDFVSARGGKPLIIDFLRDGKEESVTIAPANAVVPGAEGRPALGVVLELIAIRTEPWGQASQDALIEEGNAFVLVAQNLWSLVASALHGAPNLSEVVGPVGIVNYVGQAAESGFGSVLLVAAVISVNLVIINLIPIPALDGGRLLVLIVEGMQRKSPPKLVIELLNVAGISLIVLLMFAVTWHDISHLLFNG